MQLLVLCISSIFIVRSEFLQWDSNYDSYNIDLTNHIQTTDTFQTARNTMQHKVEQNFKGISVFDAHLVIENTKPVFGKYVSKSDLEHHIKTTIPQINKPAAIQIALNALNISSNDLFGNNITKLYIYHHNNIPYLCWLIRFSYHIQLNIYQPSLFIDAHNGNILKVNNNPLTTAAINACGVGGNENIGMYSYCNNKPSLNISNPFQFLANKYVEVYTNKNNYYFNKENAELITCSYSKLNEEDKCLIDDYMYNGGYCASCDVFSWINIVFDLYDKWLNNTIPIDSNLLPIKAYVHVGKLWGYANWDSLNNAINFGDGTSSLFPATVLDITAHEIGHVFIDSTAHLIKSGESGAIAESYSDLIGEVAEYYYSGNNDWIVGSDMMKYETNKGIRYMYDPPLDGVSIDDYSEYYNTLNIHYASGLYNKVFYVLHTSYFWSMKELFQVFSYASKYYWNSDCTFSDGVCGAIEALHDLYGDNSTKLIIMENGLVLSFLSVGLECLLSSTNATIPRQGTPCGNNNNKYCYYENIMPLNNSQTEFTIPIIAQHDGYLSTNIDIYFTVSGEYDCINPSITFKYEQIDYEYFGNYIEIFNDENDKIIQCGGNGIIDDGMNYNHNECGVFVDCITDYHLGTNTISVNNTYKISIFESQSVQAKCISNHLLSLNPILILACNNHLTHSIPTVIPTMKPSNAPTISTTMPTKFPSTIPLTINPTINSLHPTTQSPSAKPTLMPTVNESIYDMLDGELTCNNVVYGNLTIKNDSYFLLFRANENNNFGYYVQFSSCNSTFDVVLSFYSIDLKLIDQKDDTAGCPSSLHPILSMDPLDAGDYILEISSYKGLSSGSWRMDITCIDYNELLNENNNKNKNIQNNGILCGYNRYCYDVQMNITSNNETFEFTQKIQHNKTGNKHALEYEIYLVANGEYDCYLPSITFEYERIDHYYADQFIDVYNNEDILIQRCGGDYIHNKCQYFEQCFDNNYLEWDTIKTNGESYLISIVNSNNIQPFCDSNHSYTINAILTIKCLPINSTFSPTHKPTLNPTIITTEPTIYPTVIPTVYPTTIPTFDPSSIPTFNPSSVPSSNPITTIPTLNPLRNTFITSDNVMNHSLTEQENNSLVTAVIVTAVFIIFILITISVYIYHINKKKQKKQQNETNIKTSIQMTHKNTIQIPKRL
eukprot:137725_1